MCVGYSVKLANSELGRLLWFIIWGGAEGGVGDDTQNKGPGTGQHSCRTQTSVTWIWLSW